MSGLAQLLASAAAGFMPLAAAALGGLATEYVGVLNIALEGLIMAGGFAYVAVGSAFGPWAGVAAGLAVPAVLAYLQDLFARKARADAFVTGLAFNLLVPGAASMISQAMFRTKGVVNLPALALPRVGEALAGAPVLGPLLFGHHAGFYVAAGAVAYAAARLGFMPFGLRARAAGMNPDALGLGGLDPQAIRSRAYVLSGMTAGAAGVALAGALGAWVPGLSAGRGWIALVAVYLGGKRLSGTVAASLFFAALLSLALVGQAAFSVPAELLSAMPYLLTAVAVIVGSAMKGHRAA